MSGTTVTAKTFSDAAYQQIRRDITSGQLRPGEKLKINDLVHRYGISVSPIREALSRLSSEYLVVLEGQRGFAVAPVSAKELRDISYLRKVIEAEAIQRSIENGDEEWESRIVAAYYRLQKADQRLATDPANAFHEWDERNREFHEALVSACDSIWLDRLQHMLYAQHERYRRLSISHPRPSRDLDAEHKALLDACLARNKEEAARVTALHIERTVRAVLELLQTDAPPEKKRKRRTASAQKELAD